MTTYLLGAIVRLWGRLFKSGIDEKAVHAEEDRRDRAAYEAEIAKVERDRLSAKDEAEVAELRAFVEEIGSGEFPSLAFDADPLGAPIPDGYVVEPEAFFNHLAATRLSAFTWTATPGTTVALSSVQVVEPSPYELESFTQSWTRAEVERMVAGARQAASR